MEIAVTVDQPLVLVPTLLVIARLDRAIQGPRINSLTRLPLDTRVKPECDDLLGGLRDCAIQPANRFL
jgi:hypothetical protein